MSLVLGIHNGHHAGCAVVRDGILVAAIAQERVTRRKYDGQDGLSNRLPLRECLRASNTQINDFDAIISSFQAASPGGVGLHRPLVAPDFSLFDPWDPRHRVISHHRAHAACAFGSSHTSEAAVLVCDLGGSTTPDGLDLDMSFSEFAVSVSAIRGSAELRTEALSIYDVDRATFTLRHREYCTPHNVPDIFVYNAASLYDNVARMIFLKENAQGEMMALAATARGTRHGCRLKASDFVNFSADHTVIFKNGWQVHVKRAPEVLDNAPLAHLTQRVLEIVSMEHVKLARSLTRTETLCAAGGVFLNILVNSKISESGLFKRYYVPSAPHDAGIAVGCAFAGWLLSDGGVSLKTNLRTSDRLGPTYPQMQIEKTTEQLPRGHDLITPITPKQVARWLHEGKIVARCAGRSEFGPRALGGRSLLASPLCEASKRRLNAIKGRQEWRPVAPIVQEERLREFFVGPVLSPYMNLIHKVRAQHRETLIALKHPDSSTRAQSLQRSDDEFLYDLLVEFGILSGYPVLVNTSLNGPGEPIVETPDDAMAFFSSCPDIDTLVFDDRAVLRSVGGSLAQAMLAADAFVMITYLRGKKRLLLIRRERSMEISPATFEWLDARAVGIPTKRGDIVSSDVAEQLRQGLGLGLLTYRS